MCEYISYCWRLRGQVNWVSRSVGGVGGRGGVETAVLLVIDAMCAHIYADVC